MWRDQTLDGRRLGLVIALSGAAVLLEWLLDPVLGGSNYLIVSLAVGVAALFGGMGAGLLTTGLGTVGMVLTQFEPLGSLNVALAIEVIQTLVFVGVGIVFSYLAGLQHRALQGEVAASRQVAEAAGRTEALNALLQTLLQAPLDVGVRAETVAEALTEQTADCSVILRWDHDRLVVAGNACRAPQAPAIVAAVTAAAAQTAMEPCNPRRVARCGVAEWGTVLATGEATAVVSALRTAGVTAYAVVPIPTGVGPPDVLVLLRTTAAGFTADERRVIQTIALTVGAAIGNALLYANAERALEARDRLSAAVSHDLKNPLNVVLLSADLLQRSAVEPAQAFVRETATTIQRAAERMNLLVRDMLDLARLESGRLGLALQPLDLLAVTREAVAMVQPLALQKSQTLQVGPAAAVPAVWADRDRLLQVFSNVLGNAVAYSPEGGTITVALSGTAQEVTVAVADTGPGIRADQLPHVFDRYWRGSSGPSGTGLGLSIAKGIVEAHGGRIWAESRPGGGSTFRFTVPVAPKQVQAA